MGDIYNNRLQQVIHVLEEKELEGLMVLVGENRYYLSGFTGEDSQFDETAGALFISKDKQILATDSRYVLQAEKEAPLFEIHSYKEGLDKALPEIVERLDIKKLGFESVRLSYLQYNKMTTVLQKERPDVSFIPTEDIVENIRVIKSEDEIHRIKAALMLAENVFRDFLGIVRPGMTEKEAAWEMEKRMREAGAESMSFPTIVASGPNSAKPHAIPSDRAFRKGEPILFDWGAKLNGYCSDITRVITIGKPDETFKKVFETVKGAQEKATRAIRENVGARSVDQAAREHIDNAGFKGKFGHGLGHGVGLAVHEGPRLGPTKDAVLAKHMVFTVEPGVYLPEWGGVRLENMAAVTDDGAYVLNELGVDIIPL